MIKLHCVNNPAGREPEFEIRSDFSTKSTNGEYNQLSLAQPKVVFKDWFEGKQ